MPTNAPRGLVPIKMPLVSGVEYLKVTSTFTGDIGVGTPMVQLATGFVAPVSSAVAASQTFVGVSMVFRDGSSGKTEDIAICTDPNMKFLVQSGITAAGSTQAIVGASIGFGTPAGVNTTSGLSKTVVAGVGATASAPLRIVGRHERDGNDWGDYVDLIVQPIYGLHQRAGAAGI